MAEKYKIVVTGGGGQLGTSFSKENPNKYEIIILPRQNLDITSKESVYSTIKEIKPVIVINCAAYTNVDGCEEEKEKAFEVNYKGVLNLVEICEDVKAKLVQISTDYVFDGRKSSAYLESDVPNPISIYGTSKLAGEVSAEFGSGNNLVIRTSGLYGIASSRDTSISTYNFVLFVLKSAEKRSEVKLVTDQVLSPTFTDDLARAILKAIECEFSGTIHLVNEGEISWYEFGKKILEIIGMKPEVIPVRWEELPVRARRPQFSALKSEIISFTLPHWEDALQRYLKIIN